MDRTYQFGLIAKRILRELRALNEAITVGIKRTTEQIDAIRSENERNRHKDEPIKVRTEVVSFDDAIVRDRRRDQDRQSATQNSIKRAAWLTFGAVFLYAGVTALQWREMRKATEKAGISADAAKSAADTASSALTSVQRAIVIYQTLTNEAILDAANKVTGMEFKARYKNFGATPTRNARHRLNYKDTTAELPADYRFYDSAASRRLKDSIFAFGPQVTIDAGTVRVPQSVISILLANKTHLYFWGWLSYRDVFKNTPLHITMFCVEVSEITEVTNPAVRIQNFGQFRYTNCPKHNCEAEDCDGEPYGDDLI